MVIEMYHILHSPFLFAPTVSELSNWPFSTTVLWRGGIRVIKQDRGNGIHSDAWSKLHDFTL
ncbi:MAG: hypothetical protein KAQ71_00540, partial [Desulfobulbaceae bacterium]|nr:hypothetical protein [Desulfobulbaceae bacterium]